MSVNVEVAGQAALVRIEVIGYENLAANNPSDANWLTCRVEVRVRGFEGHLNAAFTTQDFAAFSKSLRSAVAALHGWAVFEADEDALQLKVEFNVTGTVTISGSLREPDRPGTYLAFSFESDQTFMSRTVEALDEVSHRFPVRP